MKKILFLLMGFCSLTSCTSEAYQQGVKIGERLREMRTDEDFNNFPTIISDYNAIEDSISAIEIGKLQELSDGLDNAVKDYGDSIIISSRVLSDSPTGFGSSFAKEISEIVLKDKTTVDNIISKISIVHYLYSKTGESASNVEFNNAFQGYIDSLDVNKQMLIYTKISTPQALANAIANDIQKVHNIQQTRERINVIKNIYQEGTPENIQFFNTLKHRLPEIEINQGDFNKQ